MPWLGSRASAADLAPLRRWRGFPPEGGRTHWTGEAGSTGALAAVTRSGGVIWLPPAPLARLPPEGGRTHWTGEAGSTGALAAVTRSEGGSLPLCAAAREMQAPCRWDSARFVGLLFGAKAMGLAAQGE